MRITTCRPTGFDRTRTMTDFRAAAFAAAFGIVAALPASAQPSDQPGPETAPVPSNPAPPAPHESSGSSASDKLSHSRGVITPPATGDENVMPPPSAGTASTPVIPPPGSNGNGPVQPK